MRECTHHSRKSALSSLLQVENWSQVPSVLCTSLRLAFAAHCFIILRETWPNAALFYVRHDPTFHCSIWDMTQHCIILCETWPSASLFYVSHDPPRQFRDNPTLQYSILKMTQICWKTKSEAMLQVSCVLVCALSLLFITSLFYARHDSFTRETQLIPTRRLDFAADCFIILGET